MKDNYTITFSIGIPAFKSHFLKECIDSVLSQSYHNFELIIVNDCSPHPVNEVVAGVEDARIRYFENDKNIGAEHVVNNWNRCLVQAKGDFFILLGDDDTLDPDYLKEFVQLIQKYPDLDVYHCRSTLIDENSTPYFLTPSTPEFESVYDNIWHRITEHRIQFISDFVYRTSTLKEMGGYFFLPLAWGSDDLTSYRACGTKGIAHTNKPIFNYRNNRYSISSTGNFSLKMEAFRQIKAWFHEFLKEPPKDRNDEITYNNIIKSLNSYFTKREERTVAAILRTKSLTGMVAFYFKYARGGLTMKQYLTAFLYAWKDKRKNPVT